MASSEEMIEEGLVKGYLQRCEWIKGNHQVLMKHLRTSNTEKLLPAEAKGVRRSSYRNSGEAGSVALGKGTGAMTFRSVANANCQDCRAGTKLSSPSL